MKPRIAEPDSMERRFSALYPCLDAKRHSHPKGYVYLHLPRHPFADSGGNVLEHRAVVEQQIGRFLYHTEVVHHRDRIRDNNDPDNLQVVINHYEHMALEHSSLSNDALVQTVLEAALNSNISLTDLPCAPATARKICSYHGVQWVSPAQSNLNFDTVKTELQNGSLLEAAKKLGVSAGTLRRNYPELIRKTRSRPGFLEKSRESILKLRADGMSYEKLADLYATNKVTIGAALRRWESEKPMALGRKKMNFLESDMQTIIEMLRLGKSLELIGQTFVTSRIVVREQLYRWEHAGELPLDIIALLARRRRRKPNR